jgi:small subunit ribosomal protein S20
MPITSSATRALRVSARKRVYNLARSRAMQNAIRAVRDAVTAGKGKEEAGRLAYKAIDKAAKRGVIKKASAARRKAQVAKLLDSRKK